MSTARTLHGWSYSGTAWTNRDGRAVVALPPAVLADRAGFDYELDADRPTRAHIHEPIGPDGPRPHARVAWRVTPYRNDEPASVADGGRS
jgi:hypothetical protein